MSRLGDVAKLERLYAACVARQARAWRRVWDLAVRVRDAGGHAHARPTHARVERAWWHWRIDAAGMDFDWVEPPSDPTRIDLGQPLYEAWWFWKYSTAAYTARVRSVLVEAMRAWLRGHAAPVVRAVVNERTYLWRQELDSFDRTRMAPWVFHGDPGGEAFVEVEWRQPS